MAKCRTQGPVEKEDRDPRHGRDRRDHQEEGGLLHRRPEAAHSLSLKDLTRDRIRRGDE
jgi:hypothetical protein